MTPSLTINVKLTGPLFQGKAPAIVQGNQEACITEMVMFLLPKIRAATPVGASGEAGLRATIQADFQGKGTPFFKGIIGTPAKHGLAVEKGRTAGKPVPKDLDLSPWIAAKFGVDLETAKKLNFVVKRAIMRKGTIKRFGYQGAEMFGGTLEQYFPQLQEIAQRHGFGMAKELSGV